MFILLMGLIIGCSSQESGSTEKNGIVTIKMAVSGSEQEKKLRYETADLFMKENPTIKIEWVDIGDERRQKTLTLISGGKAPDILYINEWTLPLAERNVLMPLDDTIAKDTSFDISEFYPDVLDAYRLNGKLYGLPQEVSPLVMYYNKNLFDQAGVPYPTDDWTQEDFVQIAKKLTDSKKKKYGYLSENWYGHYMGWLNRNGGKLFSDDGKKSGFDTPEALKALELMNKIVVEDHSSPNPAEQEAAGQGSDAQFRNQQVAMISSGMWLLPAFKSEPLNFDWDVVKMPKGETQATTAGVLSWSISKDTKHPEEAWKVLKFFVGHEGMKIVAKYNMALPASNVAEANQMILDSKFPANVKAFVDSAALVNLDNFKHPKTSELDEKITTEIEKMLLHKQSPADAQKKIVEQMNSIMGQ